MDEGLKREFLVRATIDQFATDTGLAHIRHIALDKVPAHVKLWQQNGRMRLQQILQDDLKAIEKATDELDEVFKTKDYGIPGAKKFGNILDEVKNDIESGIASNKYVYHTTDERSGIIKNGLASGGIAGLPQTDSGLGDVVHVFRRSDFPANTSFADVSYTSGYKPVKPIATFGMDELGIKPEKRPFGYRAQELGDNPEPPYVIKEAEQSAAILKAKRLGANDAVIDAIRRGQYDEMAIAQTTQPGPLRDALRQLLDEIGPDAKPANKPIAVSAKKAAKEPIPKDVRLVIDKINEGKLDDLATNPDIVTNFRVALRGFLKDIKAGPKVNSAIARFEKHIEEYRRFRSLNETANKINEIAGKKVFETNLATIFWKEENRLNEAVIYHDYLKKLIDANLDFVQKIDPTKVVEIPKDFARIDDELLGSFHVHKDLLEPFRLTVNYAKGQGDDWAEFVKLTDRVTSNIKYSILIPFPKFHIRNIVSEISFNAIAGMNPLLDPKILEDYTFALKEWKLAKAGKASEWYIRAIKDGAIQTGFMRSEAATEIAGKWKKIPGVGHYLRGMETVGSLSEEMPRLAMYRWAQRGGVARLKKFSVKSAGELVSRFHVDYSKLTPFERSSLRRLMPFYSWYRFNIPMNIKMLQEAPGFYANVDKTRKAITEARGGELPQDWTPEYIREGYAIGWSKSPGKKTYIIMRGWYPAADLSSVTSIDNAKDQFVGMLHPAKIIPETIWGYDTFTKRKIPAYPGQKVKMFGVNIPARPAHLLAPIRVIQETNALIFGKTTYQSKFYDRIVYAIFGKMYEVDEAKVKKYLKWDMERMINDIENKGIPNAQKNGDYRTVRTLQKQATKLKAQEAKL
jgi:hypothetical protein